jgi:GDPmannose 4,6-dehydratase
MPGRALITGITGQDGSYLAELLLSKGYEVHGLVLPAELEHSGKRLDNIETLRDRLLLYAGDLVCSSRICEVVAEARPQECYHLAARSFAGATSGDAATLEANIGGTRRILAAVNALAPECRFFFAASSEMFGNVDRQPQNETCAFRPRSSYGVSKVRGFDLTRNYREAYGLHASSGILFNHESPRRGREFVTRRITSGIARLLAGQETELQLGDLEARRDWGHAREYVEAMWLMLQQPEPDDYVIATGETHTVREFVELAFAHAGLDWRKYVRTSPDLLRAPERGILCGDASKAHARLGWQPKTRFPQLVHEMVEADCRALGVAWTDPASQ